MARRPQETAGLILRGPLRDVLGQKCLTCQCTSVPLHVFLFLFRKCGVWVLVGKPNVELMFYLLLKAQWSHGYELLENLTNYEI